MPVFYLLHNVLKKEESYEDISERNSKLFLLGSIIYVILFVIVYNLRLRTDSPLYDTVKYGLVYLVIADMLVMGYKYRKNIEELKVFEKQLDEILKEQIKDFVEKIKEDEEKIKESKEQTKEAEEKMGEVSEENFDNSTEVIDKEYVVLPNNVVENYMSGNVESSVNYLNVPEFVEPVENVVPVQNDYVEHVEEESVENVESVESVDNDEPFPEFQENMHKLSDDIIINL